MIGVTVAFANDPKSGMVYYGCESIFFYLTAYAMMTLGAFGVIIALRTKDRSVETIDDLTGLGATRPLPALALAVCLLSLSGIPPLAGFWGKLEIFTAAFAASPEENGPLVLLSVIGVLNAAVGAYYYLRIVVTMYLKPARQDVQTTGGLPVALAVTACPLGSFVFGLFPAPINRAARRRRGRRPLRGCCQLCYQPSGRSRIGSFNRQGAFVRRLRSASPVERAHRRGNDSRSAHTWSADSATLVRIVENFELVAMIEVGISLKLAAGVV